MFVVEIARWFTPRGWNVVMSRSFGAGRALFCKLCYGRGMVKVLWVEGSPKGERSLSTACARSFLDAVSADVLNLEVTHRDVWDGSVLTFDREAALAKFGPLF